MDRRDMGTTWLWDVLAVKKEVRKRREDKIR